MTDSYEKAVERKERFYRKATNIESNDERRQRKRKSRESYSPSREAEKEQHQRKNVKTVQSTVLTEYVLPNKTSVQQVQGVSNNSQLCSERAQGIIGYRQPVTPAGSFFHVHNVKVGEM